MYKIPILLISFIRAESTRRIIDSLRLIKPEKIYLYCDGPRPNKSTDQEYIHSVQKVLSEIDWKCNVKKLYLKFNHGPRVGILRAINWMLENEEMGIILEDDCLPTRNFFNYMNELLNKYVNDDRIMHVSGTSFNQHQSTSQIFYNGCCIPNVSGWGTWSRAWKKYTNIVTDSDLEKIDFLLEKNFGKDKTIKRYWKLIFKKINSKKVLDSWDYPWTYSIWKNNGICINPSVSMINYLGFDEKSTHGMIRKRRRIVSSKIPMDILPIFHPPKISTNIENNILIMNLNFLPTFIDKLEDISYKILPKIKQL